MHHEPPRHLSNLFFPQHTLLHRGRLQWENWRISGTHGIHLQPYSLTNTFLHAHPQDAHHNLYLRGSHCINYALLSHHLLPHINSIGMLPFHHLYASDHYPHFLDLSPAMFQNQAPILAHAFHHITSSSPLIPRLITHTFQHLQDNWPWSLHQSFLHHLSLPTPHHHLANKLDHLITQALLSAKRKCTTPSHPSDFPTYKRLASLSNSGKLPSPAS